MISFFHNHCLNITFKRCVQKRSVCSTVQYKWAWLSHYMARSQKITVCFQCKMGKYSACFTLRHMKSSLFSFTLSCYIFKLYRV